MKINRDRSVLPTEKLGAMFCGEVVYQSGKGPALYLVGEGGLGIDSQRRHLINLSDGSVLVVPKDQLVVRVEGEFVCAH